MGNDRQPPPQSFFLFSFFVLPVVAAYTGAAINNSNYGGRGCSTPYQHQQPNCWCYGCQPARAHPPAPTRQKPEGPKPSDFPNLRLYESYLVIQRFKSTITCDPRKVTSSWSGTSICQKPNYRGIYCDNRPGNASELAVASIDFNGFGLCAPTVAGFLDMFPDLAIFHINSNNFAGTIPDLSHLKYVYELDLSNNKFTGRFPREVLGLSQLLFLDIRYNFFFGSVPASVFAEHLAVLFLNNNLFQQSLPYNLGATTAKYLTLANNAFIGSIPLSIGKASDTLVEVLFLNNYLTGCLPYEIGLLRKATVFDVGDNFITGPIPHSFACLASVEQLNLANNLLYGDVPEAVCEISSLENFTLSGNYFTGLGPICRRLWKRGVLNLRQNCIPNVPMQRPHRECWAFHQSAVHCPPPSTHRYVPCGPCTGAAASGGLGCASTNPQSRPARRPPRSYHAANSRNQS